MLFSISNDPVSVNNERNKLPSSCPRIQHRFCWHWFLFEFFTDHDHKIKNETCPIIQKIKLSLCQIVKTGFIEDDFTFEKFSGLMQLCRWRLRWGIAQKLVRGKIKSNFFWLDQICTFLKGIRWSYKKYVFFNTCLSNFCLVFVDCPSDSGNHKETNLEKYFNHKLSNRWPKQVWPGLKTRDCLRQLEPRRLHSLRFLTSGTRKEKSFSSKVETKIFQVFRNQVGTFWLKKFYWTWKIPIIVYECFRILWIARQN